MDKVEKDEFRDKVIRTLRESGWRNPAIDHFLSEVGLEPDPEWYQVEVTVAVKANSLYQARDFVADQFNHGNVGRSPSRISTGADFSVWHRRLTQDRELEESQILFQLGNSVKLDT